MEALIGAGKQDELVKVIDDHTARAVRAYDEIRHDPTRTDDYKRQQLAASYLRHRDRLDAKLVDMASGVVRTDRADAKTVFGTAGLDGDPASLAISRRDAADRVASIQSVDELRTLLARATRSGDEVLARAVAERALENQDADTMNAFLADRPQLEAPAERLWRSTQAVDRDSIMISFRMTGLMPQELSGTGGYAIDALASQAAS